MNDLSETNNPTYEYYPRRGEPKILDSLDWAFPYNLYPAVYQLAHGPVLIFTSNRTDLLDSQSDTLIDQTYPIKDILLNDKLPWLYPHTPTSVMMPLTKANKYTSHLMACGGSRKKDLKADERCIAINFADENPQWAETQDPMPVGRLMPDSAILPDGSILFMNGGNFPIRVIFHC